MLALTLGDPAGIGPEITIRAWRAAAEGRAPGFFAIGDPDALAARARQMGDPVDIEIVDQPARAIECWRQRLPIIPVLATAPIRAGAPDPGNAKTIIDAIRLGAAYALAGEAMALVTNPISKAVLYQEGFSFPGHTEFLASLCHMPNTAQPVMMLVGPRLKVALATIHLPLSKVAGAISTSFLVEVGRIVDRALKTDFGLSAPRLQFAGLNPHAGEAGAIGREEVDIINPAVAQLRTEGVDALPAASADSLFQDAARENYDCVIAMYHDQGLIPAKTLDFWDTVNVTLGLPIIRTSPDHGVAFDRAAVYDANPQSLIAALRLAFQMATRRRMSPSRKD